MRINMTKTNSAEKVVINVGGVKHKTLWSTLEKIPGTRLYILARLKEKDESYDADEDEYYFDRNPEAFLSIMEYYRSDELHITDNVCGNAMKKELDFWGIYETEIEACCWGEYSKFLDHRETLANLDSTFGGAQLENKDMQQLSKLRKFQMIVWNNLEYPSYSRGAKVLMFLSIFVVMVSILSFICESHYWFQVLKNDTSIRALDPEIYYPAANKQCCGATTSTETKPETKPVIYLSYIDWACMAFFCIELGLRFIFAPDKCRFMKSLLTIIDLICIVPQMISIILETSEELLGAEAVTAGNILQLSRILRMIRVLRIFKLMKHYSAFKVLAYTIKVSTKELLLMVVFLMSGVMVFASIIHYAEPTNFTSIPIGIWWALVTMTTVGYGDRVPNTAVGYVFGCMSVIGGVLVIAFTVPIVVNNFTLYYSHANSRAKLPSTIKKLRAKPKIVTSPPKQVSVSPSFNTLPERDAESPLSANTQDSNTSQDYDNNLNIRGEDNSRKLKPSKFSFDTRNIKGSNGSTQLLVGPKITNQHEMEARELVNSMTARDKLMLNERRRQYMMAFKRLENKRKRNDKHNYVDLHCMPAVPSPISSLQSKEE